MLGGASTDPIRCAQQGTAAAGGSIGGEVEQALGTGSHPRELAANS
jgi:hypothetical protein